MTWQERQQSMVKHIGLKSEITELMQDGRERTARDILTKLRVRNMQSVTNALISLRQDGALSYEEVCGLNVWRSTQVVA